MSERPLRTIKSFVRRKGRSSQTRNEALKNNWQDWGLSNTKQFLNFDEIFHEKGALILEIGFGMGDSLIDMASKHPNDRFIGIEVHTPGIGNVLLNITQNKLSNIRLFHEDALLILHDCIPDNSLDRVQLFFPDPWPKTHHQKRRIVQPAFIQLISKKLKPNGIFHLATDWEDYAKQMIKLLELESTLSNQFGKNNFAPRPEWRTLTKFEKRGQKLGHGIWDLLFNKQATT